MTLLELRAAAAVALVAINVLLLSCCISCSCKQQDTFAPYTIIMPPFHRSELEEMVKRWVKANDDAERDGDWSKRLAKFYTMDAEYRWNIGPNQEYCARGRQDILDVALGYWTRGFEEWKYPFHDVIMDEQRGTVIVFYKQVAPHLRDDGIPYEVAGMSGSWFEYAGNFQWKWQRDFFDVGNVKSLFFELAGAGLLEPAVKQKIHDQARGVLLPGVERLRPEPSLCTKLQNFVVLVRIAVLGV